MLSLADVKKAIREPYAWPGGYPLYFVMADGEALSIDAARENFREICSVHIQAPARDWTVAAVAVNWEDANLYCAHTNKRIPSAYAED